MSSAYSSDCHGFENLCRLQVGYTGVEVWVRFIQPLPYPYPQCGLAVYPPSWLQVFDRSLNRDQLWSTRLISSSTSHNTPLGSTKMTRHVKKASYFIYYLVTIFLLTHIILFSSPHKLAANWPLPSNEWCRPPNVNVNGSWSWGWVCGLGTSRKYEGRPMVWETCEVREKTNQSCFASLHLLLLY